MTEYSQSELFGVKLVCLNLLKGKSVAFKIVLSVSIICYFALLDSSIPGLTLTQAILV